MLNRIIAVAYFLFFSLQVNAVAYVDITRSNIEPVRFAFTDFDLESKSLSTQSLKIREVMINDLQSTGLLKLIDPSAYIQEIILKDQTPTFASWRQINAAILISGYFESSMFGIYKVRLKCYDIYSQRQILDVTIDEKQTEWRKLSHKLADEVYKALTGEKGYFNTKITFVDVTGTGRNKVRKLAIMDSDGHNLKYLTSGDKMVLTPRFSHDTSKILYLSYESPMHPDVKMIDTGTLRKSNIGKFPGMSYAPRFVPGTDYAVLTAEKKGISNIYKVDFSSNSATQLTSCNSICTSPSPSPDGKKIVFNSDMGGGRHLYVMNSDGSGIKRISTGKGYYTGPVWSPRGDLIAFTKTLGGDGFYIGVMRPDGTGERLIATGWLVEGASWAPSGRVVLFEKSGRPNSSGGAISKLHAIDISGNFEREIKTPNAAIDGNWSDTLD